MAAVGCARAVRMLCASCAHAVRKLRSCRTEGVILEFFALGFEIRAPLPRGAAGEDVQHRDRRRRAGASRGLDPTCVTLSLTRGRGSEEEPQGSGVQRFCCPNFGRSVLGCIKADCC